jgi:hypothetical protein
MRLTKGTASTILLEQNVRTALWGFIRSWRQTGLPPVPVRLTAFQELFVPVIAFRVANSTSVAVPVKNLRYLKIARIVLSVFRYGCLTVTSPEV